VVVEPERLTINETGELLLFCSYNANPASLTSVRWLLNNKVVDMNLTRYDGGNSEITALLVRNVTRDDSGKYTCELTNQIGTGTSENGIEVAVQCERFISVFLKKHFKNLFNLKITFSPELKRVLFFVNAHNFRTMFFFMK
jgi:hypothetical protein